jgi:hypothetical protein
MVIECRTVTGNEIDARPIPQNEESVVVRFAGGGPAQRHIIVGERPNLKRSELDWKGAIVSS